MIKSLLGTLKALFISTLVLAPVSAHCAVVGHWTFEAGEQFVDRTGNFGDLELHGNARVVDGTLDVNGVGQLATGWAVAQGYKGGTIIDKTLVSWISLESLASRVSHGSALTLDNQGFDQFDGIIFSELQTNKWMAGSDYLRRSNGGNLSNQTSAESMTGQLLQMAVTYDDLDNLPGGQLRISAYRNGFLLGSYLTSNSAAFSGTGVEAIFGARHTLGSTTRGALDAKIHEATIFDKALTQSELSALTLTEISAIPLPAALPLMLAALGGLGMIAHRRQK